MNTLEELKQAEESEPMAVYVVPWPKNCGHCQMTCKLLDVYILNNSKPDWCPLRPLPEKQYGSLFIGTPLEPLYDSFRDGWNACLNVIMGGEE